MSVWAAFADVHGGIWGASRHALTVGFAATMVFAIGPRILPHFAGIQSIFSKRLMLLSLLCLQTGCLLRVSSEPLAYEGLVSFAWKVLPVSGMLELAGVLIFASNLMLTFLAGPTGVCDGELAAQCTAAHKAWQRTTVLQWCDLNHTMTFVLAGTMNLGIFEPIPPDSDLSPCAPLSLNTTVHQCKCFNRDFQ